MPFDGFGKYEVSLDFDDLINYRIDLSIELTHQFFEFGLILYTRRMEVIPLLLAAFTD
jgi:hypothetical protein